MKIRYNLGRGSNYRKWKISYNDSKGKRVHIYLYEDVTLTLVRPRLLNNRTRAEAIFNGANKSVCAWIECEDILIGGQKTKDNLASLEYNPKKTPYWVAGGNTNVDGKVFNKILVKDKKLFIILR